ncbi:MAG: AMP-binding protein, partial [Victivallales bacterium]|nr:AMP-binding protein [Victivallales bacterium]
LNRPGNEKLGTVGTIIDCLEWLITDENDNPVPQGTTGMLNVRGDSIFPGYLDYDGPSPFVTIQGKEWYRTGDLVQADEAGRIIFMGRLKRFVKIGGEMVSLPAIEEVLLKLYRTKEQPNPLAVEARGDDAHPEIVLFSVMDLQKEDINLQLREAGFAPIYNIKQVIKIPEIPLLGSGKTDYRSLKAMLTQKS